jgi:hypothetical protein
VSLQNAILDAVEMGYEVTFRPFANGDAIRVDLRRRNEYTVSTASGSVSKLLLRQAHDPQWMTYFFKKLLRSVANERIVDS